MSDAVSALPDVAFDGIARLQESGLRGLITLRGDLGAAGLQTAVKKLTGVALPGTGKIALQADFGAAWMSPDELLILTPYADAVNATATLSRALKGSHHLVANVSDARATFTLTGERGREVLAKLSPADLSPAGFSLNQFRRTRLAQVPVAFWFGAADEVTPDEITPDEITLVCFRSVAEYVFDLLANAATPGSQVNYF